MDERIVIGNAHYFRIPFPADLFDRSPAPAFGFRPPLPTAPPVRKTNAKYRGTILEWGFSKIGESFDQFRRRCSTVNPAAAPEEDAELEDGPTGDWNWTVKQRLRTRGTVEKDWFEAPASDLEEEVFLCVIGRRGWMTKETQDAGFEQSYAVAIEIAGVAIPIHERIEALVRVQVPIRT